MVRHAVVEPFLLDLMRESLPEVLQPDSLGTRDALWLYFHISSILTQGFAASLAFACGAAGAAIGMSQTYWIGPLAKAVGGLYGGDIAMWLCMGSSGMVYPGLRYWELRTYGR